MNYSDVMYKMQVEYGRVMNDIGLTIYQALACASENMEVYLWVKDDKAQIAAYTALLAVAVRGGVKFIADEPFTRDLFEELAGVYAKLGAVEFDEVSDRQLIEDINLVKHHTGVGKDFPNTLRIG